MTHLQEVLLMMASDIDAFLKENNIRYFLDGGTALGAIRHKGFIPWDDDFDIIILPEDYGRFVQACRQKLDKEKYAFEEALVDWPLHISKIKLKGTFIDEIDAYPSKERGIYIDVFCFDNASDGLLSRFRQMVFARLWVTYLLTQKPYTASGALKKFALSAAKILRWKPIYKMVRRLSRSETKGQYLSMAWARTRKNWRQYFCKRDIFRDSVYVPFENTAFPVCVDYDKYLTTCFGDYMKLPPVEKRVGLHVKDIDFGKY